MSNKEDLSEFDAHVAKRYHMEKRLGRGAYGIVWKAKSRKSSRVVNTTLSKAKPFTRLGL